jgi:beta-RFAP synthase
VIAVRTASRLHFGLLNVSASPADVIPPLRRFGGAGLMIDKPGLELTCTAAAEWSAQGPLAERLLEFARRFSRSVAEELPDVEQTPQHWTVRRAAPEHAGLGTGTQLGLATAWALSEAWGIRLDAPQLACWVGRGARSALGVHGFAQGGFLVDAGKRDDASVAPLVARLPFPADWRMVLLRPVGAVGLHGPAEKEAFAALDAAPARTEALCRLLLLGLMPALVEHDLPAFGAALYEFNRRVGEAFASVQGGTYASAPVAGLTALLRELGCRGVGQSSWGPTVFAVVGGAEEGEELARALCKRTGAAVEIVVSSARNLGAVCRRVDASSDEVGD